jgi:CRISPR system Cascade subunit CasB
MTSDALTDGTSARWGTAIGQIAARLRSPDFSPGALASLRRHDPGMVMGQPAFHRLVAGLPDGDLDDRHAGALRWATVVHAMAIGARPGEAPPDAKAGAALAQARLTEARLTRLLAARDDGFRDQVVLVARATHAKAIGFSWGELGRLVLAEGRYEDWAESLRFKIARAYYQTLAHLEDRPKTA